MTIHFETHLHRLKQGLSAVEYIYTSHDRWPLPRRLGHDLSGPRLNISVLDSSFNPPTLAHLALADLPYPKSFWRSPEASDRFHAKLLLLSVRNADKLLKPSDATHAQRLDMMILLAKDLSSAPSGDGQSGLTSQQPDQSEDANVAVAIIDEPTFVGKSSVLLASLQERISHLSPALSSETQPLAPHIGPKPSLTFLVGMDTLDRLFSSRYYSSEESMRASLRHFLSPEGDNSRVICARRLGMKEDPVVVEERTLRAAQEFVDSQRIALIDIEERLAEFSSSEVRDKINAAIGQTVWSTMVTSSIAEYIVTKGLYLHLS